MKAMTFEEWKAIAFERCGVFGDVKNVERIWDSARVGMIPEDEAVRIPPVSEWPEWAVGMHLVFCESGEWSDDSLDDNEWKHGGRIMPSDSWIDRPVPAWVPRVGEVVFYNETESIRKIVGINNGRFQLSTGPWADIEELKPATSIEQIGKPWDEIPGGGE